MNGVGNED
jgi:hypothetical protein